MKKTISIILIAVFAAVLGSSTFYIVRHNKEADKQAELYHNLASVVEAAAQTDAETETAEPIPYSEEKTILPELAELFGQNGDLVGWISIADTNINYPVMQSVNEPNFYLKHGFDKAYSNYGVPYIDEGCAPGLSNNIVIYGHHMNDGTMFADLCGYADRGFYEGHKTIRFDTLSGSGEYEVVAAFRFNTNRDTFRYNEYTNMDEAEFAEFLENVRARALYDTDMEVEYGDTLLTLSTCEYTYKNGRFVVVAKKVG